MANEIIEVFPNEDSSVYYSPFETSTVFENGKNRKIQKPAGGKLLEHYRYMRKILIESKILIPPAEKNMDYSDANTSSTNCSTNTEGIQFFCFVLKLIYL